jgi:hypothetical protein
MPIKCEIKVSWTSLYVKETPQSIPLEADTQEELYNKMSYVLWKLIPKIPMNKLVIDKQIELLKEFGVIAEVVGFEGGHTSI